MKQGNGNIFRKETKEKNFTIIDNKIFKDNKLSYRAKGLLVSLLSLPNDWEFSESGLSKLSTDGITSVKSALKELEDNNYLKRKPIRNNKGQFSGTHYTVFEERQETLINQQKPPRLGKPTSVKPITVTTHNKELINKELNNKYIYIGEMENVKLTKEEHIKLIDRFGEKDTIEKIDNLSIYLKQTGKKYKSHYATILAWDRKNKKDNKNEKKTPMSNRGSLGSISNMYD